MPAVVVHDANVLDGLATDALGAAALVSQAVETLARTGHGLVRDPEPILSSLRAALRSRVRTAQPHTIRGRGKL
jgi:hypothetical protein